MWPFVSPQVLAVVFNLHFVSIIDSPPDACISVVRNTSVDEFSTTFFACGNKNRHEEAMKIKRIEHIAIAVKSMALAREILGEVERKRRQLIGRPPSFRQ